MALVASLRVYPLRWLAAVVSVLLLAALLGAVVYVYRLLQPERFTALLQHDLADAGLTLTLNAPAEPTLFPHPAVRLQGFQLANTGATAPLLQASDARIVVPWRALWHGAVAIERVEVDSPRIDLAELRTYVARLPHHEGPPQLPTIGVGMRMTGGTIVRNGSPLLFDLDLETGPLASGTQFGLAASARTGTGTPVTLALTTVPDASRRGAVDFDRITLLFGQKQGVTLRLDGNATWRGGSDLAAQLHGTLTHPVPVPAPPVSRTAQASPGASASAAPVSAASSQAGPEAVATDTVKIGMTPARAGKPTTLTLKLTGIDANVDARVQPDRIGAWWQRFLAASPASATLPSPFTGRAAVQRLDLGWLHASGLRIEAGTDLAPAATVAPAPSSSAGP
jgi:AsmA family